MVEVKLLGLKKQLTSYSLKMDYSIKTNAKTEIQSH